MNWRERDKSLGQQLDALRLAQALVDQIHESNVSATERELVLRFVSVLLRLDDPRSGDPPEET